ncbi:Endonuclease/exonuclease/phosphatase [Pilobolus umbonatus]|nr:Endonuclease/exonuclease/phosphatase [Pilobolus umbonatus]
MINRGNHRPNNPHHTLNLMTFNVRHDHHEDSPTTPFAPPPAYENPFDISQFGLEQPWSVRKWKIADSLLLYSPDIIALQEPVYHQILDLEYLLKEEYDWVGAGRTDGQIQGEFSAVFYKRDSVTMETWNTIWFSEQPDVPGSRGWDSKHPRTATEVKFRRNSDRTLFTLYNVHLDHKGTIAREQSAKLLLERARKASEDGAVFLLGDLNSTEVDPAYLILTGNKYQNSKRGNDTLANLQPLNEICSTAYAKLDETGFDTSNNSLLDECKSIETTKIESTQNVYEQAPFLIDTHYELVTRLNSKDAPGTLSGPYGHRDTFTSFGSGEEFKRAPIRIDFIMTLNDQNHPVQTIRYAVLSNQFDDGLFISDHRPVLAKLSW